jgi:Ca2+-binding RTX toxin-like protein
MMTQKFILRTTVILLGALIVFGAANAVAASNTVSSSRLDELSSAITVNNKKPAACTMNLTAIYVCTGGNCDAPAGVINQLILGTSGDERIRGRGGQDCILGGDGNDRLVGNGAGDVCIGGPGDDEFATCETCTGGPGIDDFTTCTNVTDRGPGE